SRALRAPASGGFGLDRKSPPEPPLRHQIQYQGPLTHQLLDPNTPHPPSSQRVNFARRLGVRLGSRLTLGRARGGYGTKKACVIVDGAEQALGFALAPEQA